MIVLNKFQEKLTTVFQLLSAWSVYTVKSTLWESAEISRWLILFFLKSCVDFRLASFLLAAGVPFVAIPATITAIPDETWEPTLGLMIIDSTWMGNGSWKSNRAGGLIKWAARNPRERSLKSRLTRLLTEYPSEVTTSQSTLASKKGCRKFTCILQCLRKCSNFGDYQVAKPVTCSSMCNHALLDGYPLWPTEKAFGILQK